MLLFYFMKFPSLIYNLSQMFCGFKILLYFFLSSVIIFEIFGGVSMFKEYIYVDGKAVLIDEKNNRTLTHYHDRLDDFLVEENLVETIEKRIKKLDKKKYDLIVFNKKRYFPYCIPLTLAISSFFVWSIGYIGFPTDFQSILTLLLYSFGIVAGIAMEFDSFKCRKMKQKEEVGVSSELEFLKGQLLLKREKLHQLEIEKSLEHDNKEFRTVKVNDKIALQELNRQESVYYDLGYHWKLYYAYYQMGKLHQRLRKYYSDEEVQLVQQYLEENKSSLTRKKDF